MDSQRRVSKVVHLRDVPKAVTENELLAITSPFGSIAHFVVLRAKRQVMIEMEDVRSAASLVNYFATSPCVIRGQRVEVQFSNHSELERKEVHSDDSKNSQNAPPNRILLITVHDCVYPMTVEVVHQVFSVHGPVEKIVVFNKPIGVQVLVQYSNVESATHALQALQGQHVYAGVCRLQIQYSKLPDLTVARNNERSRDYLNPNLPTDTPALLPTPATSPAGPTATGATHHFPAPFFDRTAHHAPFVPFPGAGGSDKTVLLLANLNRERTTCQALFNLFSLYGNVVRIKIFFNKPEHALVQMADAAGATAALQNLKGCILFGSTIDVAVSKHKVVNEDPNVEESKFYGDFSASKLNRYRGNSATLKHVYPPSATLHVSNLAKTTTEEALAQHFSQHGTVVSSKRFEANDRPMCLIQFSTPAAATDALVLAHGTLVDGHTLRVAFSRSVISATASS